MDTLVQLEKYGHATGLQHECDAWPDIKVESLGGVIVGLLQSEGEAEGSRADRVWIAGALTSKQLESYADKAELAMARDLIESLG